MRAFMLWHGGSSYAVGGYGDIEAFASLREAKEAFRGRVEDSYYPCVSTDTPDDGGPEAWLWVRVMPPDDGDLYPAAILRFGPRGGVVVDPA